MHTRIFGIYLALGAQKKTVMSKVFLHGIKLAFAGIFAGFLGAFLVAQFMKNVLFHTELFDIVITLGVVFLLVL